MKHIDGLDGLRGIAVLFVVFYHFQQFLFIPGYIGVDFFFVISGFLITSIICTGIQRDNFDFFVFYSRRIKRILPVVSIVVLFVTIVFLFLFNPIEYQKLYSSVIYNTVFLSNVFFYKTSGYFGSEAIETPLLHLWSLSVEEQFYFIYPLFLTLSFRFLGEKKLISSLIFIGAISLFLSIWITGKNQPLAYLLPFTRAWELISGALVYFLIIKPKVKLNFTFDFIFLFSILGMFLFVDKDSFPGFSAIFPVYIACYLIVKCHNVNSYTSFILSFPMLRFVGRISFSLYLLHWPAVVLLNDFGFDFSLLNSIIVILVLIFISFVTYEIIENRFRYTKSLSFVILNSIALPIILTFSIFYISKLDYFSYKIYGENHGFYNDMNSKPESLSFSCFSNQVDLENESSCLITKSERADTVNILLIGDSHANQYIPAFKESYSNKKYTITNYSMGSCPMLADAFTVQSEVCKNRTRNVYSLIENRSYDYVVISNYWSNYSGYLKYTNTLFDSFGSRVNLIDAVDKSINFINESGSKVVILGSIPILSDDELYCFEEGLDCVVANNTVEDPFFSHLESENSDYFNFFPVSDLFCVDNFSCKLVIHETFIYRDNNHLNSNGSALLLFPDSLFN
ncbi:putative acyltransferase protein; membrane protein [Vibrio coralliirubri]|uniref:acyltransferase family protein n=1 Tax=Vibrio coralliirubri TaxID=1516159 RepID=UPI000632C29A|nr:acyltransferase family protein [Vibrio coralliirubri]CDT93466.1 putative acyltransferase protein; membrane protein [Vibrio coralliirubri]